MSSVSAPQVQILSYKPGNRGVDSLSNNSRSSASFSPDIVTKELPNIAKKQQEQQQQQQAKTKKKNKQRKQQQPSQQKSLSDTESRAAKPQQQQQQHRYYRQATIAAGPSGHNEWRNPNEIDYSDPNGRRRDQDGINAPLLHRRLDAAIQRIDRIGSPKKLKKEMRELRQQFAALEARVQDYQDMRDSLSYQQGVVASVNARLAKLESDMTRLSSEAGELTHLIKTPGALEEEQLRATREKISKKRQQQQQQQPPSAGTAGSSQAGGSKIH